MLVSQSRIWWHNHYKEVLSASPFFVFAGLYLVSLWPFNYFLEIVKEDHLIEYLQFWVLIAGMLVSFYQSYKLYKQGNKWFILSLLVGLGFLFLAGDEIFWGQRILGIQTPEALTESNRQGETTIHNLYAVEWLVGWGYALIAILGVLGWDLTKVFFHRWPGFARFFPDRSLVGYFVFPAVFFTFHMMSGSWSEPMELFLYTGIVLWSQRFFREVGQKKAKNN